jgi:hypothetical protein
VQVMCRFSDAGNDDLATRSGRPASEKRQGTKSREVRSLAVPQGQLWGFKR